MCFARVDHVSPAQCTALHLSLHWRAVPQEAWIFLAATTVLLLLVILAILYLEQVACFKYCGGQTCFDVASTEEEAGART